MYIVECEVPATPGQWAKQAGYHQRANAIEYAETFRPKGYTARVRDDTLVPAGGEWSQVVWCSNPWSRPEEPTFGPEPKCPDQPNDGRRWHCNEKNCVVCAATASFMTNEEWDGAVRSAAVRAGVQLLDEFKPDVTLEQRQEEWASEERKLGRILDEVENRPPDPAVVKKYADAILNGEWTGPSVETVNLRQAERLLGYQTTPKTVPLYRELARLVTAYRHPSSTEADKERYAGQWRELCDQYLPSGGRFTKTWLDSKRSDINHAWERLEFSVGYRRWEGQKSAAECVVVVQPSFSGLNITVLSWDNLPREDRPPLEDVFRSCLEELIPVEDA